MPKFAFAIAAETTAARLPPRQWWIMKNVRRKKNYDENQLPVIGVQLNISDGHIFVSRTNCTCPIVGELVGNMLLIKSTLQCYVFAFSCVQDEIFIWARYEIYCCKEIEKKINKLINNSLLEMPEEHSNWPPMNQRSLSHIMCTSIASVHSLQPAAAAMATATTRKRQRKWMNHRRWAVWENPLSLTVTMCE